MSETYEEIRLRKEGHTYLFRFDSDSRKTLLGVLAKFAADPQLNFSWHDASALCRKIREDGVKTTGRAEVRKSTP
jgi:hypothetical protein